MILKIVLCVVLALGVGNVYQFFSGRWSKSSYEKKITELQNQNTELKVIQEKQIVEIERLKNRKIIKRRVVHEQEKVDRDIGDPDAVIRFFRLRRTKGAVPNAPDGRKGGARPSTG